MSVDEFTRLLQYVTKRFDRLDNILDSFLNKQESDDQERLVMGHQISRIDGWTHELAKKIGHKLAN